MIREREAVVLAGGYGTRLAHIVPDVPKPMAPVAGRPFLRYVLDLLDANGFSRIIIADGYKRDQIEHYFGNQYRGMKIVYSPEDVPLLTGGAVKKALELCTSEWVYVLNGDTYLDIEFDTMDSVSETASSSIKSLLATRTVSDGKRYATLEIGSDGIIRQYAEKLSAGRGVISGGAYLMRRDCLLHEPSVFSLETDYFERIVSDGCLMSVPCSGLFIDIGIPEDYEKSQTLLKHLYRNWKIAFFDRDGTINVDTGHLFEIEKLSIIPKCIDVLKRYTSDPSFKVVVVTNQAGIAKGLYTEEDMSNLHKALDSQIAEYDCRIDAYYHCPHHPEFTGTCECRKPAPGLLVKAMFDYDAFPEDCLLYGDKASDMKAAASAGVTGILVCNENDMTEHRQLP